MVNKTIKRRPSHPPKHKDTKASSQTACGEDLTTDDGPADDDDSPALLPPEVQTPGQSRPGFPDRVYLLASVVFQSNQLEKPAAHQLVNYGKRTGVPLPKVRDQEMQRAAYVLAFNTLKYQELLEDIMIDSFFCFARPMPDDQMSLVAVMLYDFQDRKFLPRGRRWEQEVVQEVRQVESWLLGLKTKLAASLARCRIKQDLLTIECVLPESVKTKQERTSSLPLYTWVNTLRSSVDEVHSVLRSEGFSQVQSIGQLEERTFCQDPHCRDLLVFPAPLKAELCRTELLSEHKLIIQDKSCSLGPNAACDLLPEEGDVLVVGRFSGLTVAHTASLIAAGNGNNQTVVHVCVGDRTPGQREELQQTVTAMGCKNMRLIPEVFQSLDSGDKRLQRVRVILLTPKCSLSAISDPVEFILQGNGDTDVLRDLCHGSIAPSKLEALVAQQQKDIDHALKFPKVSAVVYSTCSSHSEENEQVVSRALERAKTRTEKEWTLKLPNFRLSSSSLIGSLLHAGGPEETEPFFMLEPSEQSNGCFLAILTRELEPLVKETPQDVLAKANAKGLLDRIGSSRPTTKAPHGKTNRMTKVIHGHVSPSLLSVSVQSRINQYQHGETKSSSSPPSCGDQALTNRRQGKAKVKSIVSSCSSSSWTPDQTRPSKGITCALNKTPSSAQNPTPSSAPPAIPVGLPVARHPRALPEVPRPVALVLPRIRFPNVIPAQRGARITSSKRRSPAQTGSLSCSTGGCHRDARAKPRPWY
ncbi:putative methyltransferase NSUN7 [Genypterus blacodes]|uniref:putative methyltransferase NSUN7 n=1 Tax=Genypterus blacodes TaxID=154954 RepID=UPI003F774C37